MWIVMTTLNSGSDSISQSIPLATNMTNMDINSQITDYTHLESIINTLQARSQDRHSTNHSFETVDASDRPSLHVMFAHSHSSFAPCVFSNSLIIVSSPKYITCIHHLTLSCVLILCFRCASHDF